MYNWKAQYTARLSSSNIPSLLFIIWISKAIYPKNTTIPSIATPKFNAGTNTLTIDKIITPNNIINK